MPDVMTWKGVTWKRGETLPGARGHNRGVLRAVREARRIKAELLAEEWRARDAMRAPTQDLTEQVVKLKKLKKKRYAFKPSSGGEFMEKVL